MVSAAVILGLIIDFNKNADNISKYIFQFPSHKSKILMQTLELPEDLRITTKKSPEAKFGHIYIFSNLKEGKAMKFKDHGKCGSGIPITNAFDPRTKLVVCLFREGPNLLNLTLSSMMTLRFLKRAVIHIPKNSFNSLCILRVCSKTQRIFFYNECLAAIQIRSLQSLTIIKTYALADICQRLQFADLFSEVRSSVDLEYIPHLSSMVLLLGCKIVLMPEKKAKEDPVVLFNGKDVDNFRKIMYNVEKRVLLAVGVSAILLVQFDNFGVSGLRLLTSEMLGKSSMFLYWDPKGEMVIFSQRGGGVCKAANYHVLSYKSLNLTLVGSLMHATMYGHQFDEASQTLFLVENGLGLQKRLSSISLKDLNDDFEKSEEPVELESECLTYLDLIEPETHQYKINYIRDTLVLKPCPCVVDVFAR